jgi:hypothetical protein
LRDLETVDPVETFPAWVWLSTFLSRVGDRLHTWGSLAGRELT